MKTIRFEDLLAEQLKDGAFAEEYAKTEQEFSIAREVIELRMEHNLTQKELADLVGTSQPAIARLESGNHRNLSLSFLQRIAKAVLRRRSPVSFRRVGEF